MRLLLGFDHGIGDAAMFTSVLRHLQKDKPDWEITVMSLLGKHSCFHGLCRESRWVRTPGEYEHFRREPHPEFEHFIHLDWPENGESHTGEPSTKVEKTIREVFGIHPDPALGYQIQIGEERRAAAKAYLESISGERKVCLIHYQGNTSQDRKNIDDGTMRVVLSDILSRDWVPVILDWDRRSSFPDNQKVFCPDVEHPLWRGYGTGDGETIAALIAEADLFVGIDSGPLHIAAATDTPAIGVWIGHHPVHYIAPEKNVLNLVPQNHETHCNGHEAREYFAANYRYRVYNGLTLAIRLAVAEHMGLSREEFENEDRKNFLMQLNAKHYTLDYYTEHKAAGLDYLGYGDWQESYGRWLTESLDLRGKHVIDVGCACGSIVRGLGKAGTYVCGSDICEDMIRLGRDRWPDMAPILKVCDAINLHYWDNETFHLIHSAQSAEHWRPDHVPLILREFHRITKPGGMIFCTLDTTELCERQKRTPEIEDPTHICIRPLEWWHQQLSDAGWRLATEQEAKPLTDHPDNYFKVYDWDWFLAVKD